MPAKGAYNPICIRGHDKRIVGTRPNGWCLACAKPRLNAASKRRREEGVHRKVNLRKPICPKGHDKRVVGVSVEGRCMECRRAYSKRHALEKRRRQAGFPGDEGPIPNLKDIRLKSGLTAAEMAQRVGVSLKYYYRLESGQRNAGRKTLARVVRVVSTLMQPGVRRGRYQQVLAAMREAERRGEPTGRAIAELLGEQPNKVGATLRWASHRGLAERFENEHGTFWLVTEKGRTMVGEASR